MKKLIVFVCNGNIHRSVIAAEFFSNIVNKLGLKSKYKIDSYGLQGTMGTRLPLHKKLIEYSKEWKAAAPALRKFNIDISNHSFQKITPAVVKKAAVIIAMDKKTHSTAVNSLIKQFPKSNGKIHGFTELTSSHKGIKDPAGSNNKKLNYSIIKNINLTLLKNSRAILSWANHDKYE